MNDDVYKLRRQVINLIYEVKNGGGNLPRIAVRVGEQTAKHKNILGCAKMNKMRSGTTVVSLEEHTEKEKAIRALWTQRKPAQSEQHLTFPSACRGKGLYPSKIRASWRPFPSPSGEKGKSRAVNIAGDWPFPSP